MFSPALCFCFFPTFKQILFEVFMTLEWDGIEKVEMPDDKKKPDLYIGNMLRLNEMENSGLEIRPMIKTLIMSWMKYLNKKVGYTPLLALYLNLIIKK